MRLPTLTISPPMIEGSTVTFSVDILPRYRFQRALQRVEIPVAELLGDGDVGRDLALEPAPPACGNVRITSRDDEQAAVGWPAASGILPRCNA